MLDMEQPFEKFWSADIERFLKSRKLAVWRKKFMQVEARGAAPHWNESIVQFY